MCPPGLIDSTTRGWLGARLEKNVDWTELEGILKDAYAEVATPQKA